jgi:hypothetical protein
MDDSFMASAQLSSKELSQRGQQIYDREIRKKVGKKHRGKFLVIEVESNEYDMDADPVVADQLLRQRHPDSLFYMVRIGYRAAYKLGTRFRVSRR